MTFWSKSHAAATCWTEESWIIVSDLQRCALWMTLLSSFGSMWHLLSTFRFPDCALRLWLFFNTVLRVPNVTETLSSQRGTRSQILTWAGSTHTFHHANWTTKEFQPTSLPDLMRWLTSYYGRLPLYDSYHLVTISPNDSVHVHVCISDVSDI